MTKCLWCGKLFEQPKGVRNKKWCSTRCKSARIPFFYPHLVKHTVPVMVTKACPGCGVTFQAEAHMVRRRYCTPKCCKKQQDQRTYRRRVVRALAGPAA